MLHIAWPQIMHYTPSTPTKRDLLRKSVGEWYIRFLHFAKFGNVQWQYFQNVKIGCTIHPLIFATNLFSLVSMACNAWFAAKLYRSAFRDAEQKQHQQQQCCD